MLFPIHLSVYLLAPPRSANRPLLLHWACGRSDHPRPRFTLPHLPTLNKALNWSKPASSVNPPSNSLDLPSCPITHSFLRKGSTRNKVWQREGRNCHAEDNQQKEKPQCLLFNILHTKQSKQWTALSLEESYFKVREAKSFQPRPLPSPPLPPQLLSSLL